MIERGIIFSAPMVRALLDGRKTQTRRICKGQRELSRAQDFQLDRCPFGKPGDRLWVKETHKTGYTYAGEDACVYYRADGECRLRTDSGTSDAGYLKSTPPRDAKWTPSIFMPRRLSRITLEIVSVRVERLQSISEADARAEGLPDLDYQFRFKYQNLWESINGPGSWDANPWVWVIEFRRVES